VIIDLMYYSYVRIRDCDKLLVGMNTQHDGTSNCRRANETSLRIEGLVVPWTQ
jgi:Flp pilus assembly CpaF family ATPase